MQQDRKTKFKELSFGQKIEHIWEYYKLVLLGIAAAAAVFIYIIVKLVRPEPDQIMNVTMINANAYAVEDSTIFESFLKEKGYNTEEETIAVNSSLFFDPANQSPSSAAGYQALMAMIMVGEIDLMTADEAIIDIVGMNGGFQPLKEVLPADVLEKYKDDIYTVKNPETGEVYECGIWLAEDNPLTKEQYYAGKVLAGIPYTSEHKDIAAEVLLYLLGK